METNNTTVEAAQDAGQTPSLMNDQILNLNEIESALVLKLNCVRVLKGEELQVPEHLKKIFSVAPEHESDVRQVKMETALRELQTPLPLPVIGEPLTVIAPDFD